ncbi:hypothetical protein SAMN05518672_1011345 [Chitinophaga sp. CF118]|nr:hypothetical protein SAMN05518672_1011345 [Chitinophaga sp. CF118]
MDPWDSIIELGKWFSDKIGFSIRDSSLLPGMVTILSDKNTTTLLP